MSSHTISLRQGQILQLLLNNRAGLTIDAISKALSISRSAVQQHFSVLEKNAYITSATLTKTAGRPVRSYVITENGINHFPKQYAWFSEIILNDLKEEMGEESFRLYLSRLGKKLAQKILEDFVDQNTENRLNHLIETMVNLGFQAKSAHKNGQLNIEACNCIYHDIAQQHSEICEFDKSLISTLLDKNIELTECMAKGGHICRFGIK